MKKHLFLLSFALLLGFLAVWTFRLGPRKEMGEAQDAGQAGSYVPSMPAADVELAEGEPVPEQVAGGSESKILSLAGVEGPARDEEHRHSLGRWKARIAPSPLEWGEDARDLNFTLRMPDGQDLQLQFERMQIPGERQVIYSGRVEGSSYSQVIVSCYEDAVSGVIRLPSEGISWELRNGRDGSIELEKVDLEKLQDCSLCGVRER